jgi:hypothetical protein
MTIDELIASLKKSGLILNSVVRFDQAATPRHVRYIDLLHRKTSDELLPDAVVESGGHPFAYIVRRDRLGDMPREPVSPLAQLIRLLACRSDARYLCVVSVGTLDVYPIGLFETTPVPLTYGAELSWRTLLSGSSPLAAKKRGSKDDWLETLLFSLLVDAARGTHTAAPDLSIQQVLALIGRALFFRFLVDRNIVNKGDVRTISSHAKSLEDLFSTQEVLIDACKWLDVTFNGDLLSLEHKDYSALVQQIGPGIETVCWHLSNIQYRSLGGQLPLDWGGIMFKHVPVDVLSQVYEDFAHEFVPVLAETTSVHFTPRQIAEIVVDGAFSASQRADLHNATVLDPAAGGGVFLVLAFRRLVAEHWKAQGKRPTRKKIRSILNSQLMGFDINCDALNIAALSLYLAALELDPSPTPLNDLKFDKLIGSVLHPVLVNHPLSLQRGCEDAALGSLSEDVLAYRKGSFDIVVANPPWTGFKGDQAEFLNKKLLTLLVEENAKNKIKAEDAKTRYGSPDVAFLLAATKWAKPGAALGFILHARFLFQDATFPLRKRVFQRIRVTGLMNFTALRQDKKLWPTNSAPFALLVARNESPKSEDGFYYISPRHEPHLADVGQFRIDPAAAIPVPLDSVQTSHAFKSIFKGGLLGFKLINHIESCSAYTIGDKLNELNLQLKAGYQVGEEKNQTQDATHLQKLPMATVDMSFSVAPDSPKFPYARLQWARTPEIYEGPLLLFRESPKLERRLRGALYCSRSTAFSESFSGLSFAKTPELGAFADLLHVISYSDLFLYYQLLTSSKFGVERDAALQKDMEQFPIISVEGMSTKLRADVSALARQLRDGRNESWEQIDILVADLYELSSADVQLIKDTLANELPFSDIKKRASAPATQQDVTGFLEAFNGLVGPYQANSMEPPATQISVDSIGGWTFFRIQRNSHVQSALVKLSKHDVLGLTAIADSYWSTQLNVHLEDGSELVGRINHSRYWTRTQARLLALDWLQKSAPLTATNL